MTILLFPCYIRSYICRYSLSGNLLIRLRPKKLKKLCHVPKFVVFQCQLIMETRREFFRLAIRSVFSNKMTLCKDFVLFCFEGGHFSIIIIARNTWLFDFCLTFF
jgi:hypothetical protein